MKNSEKRATKRPLSVSVSAARTTNLRPMNVTKSVIKSKLSIQPKEMECTRRLEVRSGPTGTSTSELDGISERESSETFGGVNSGGEDGGDDVENGSHRSGGGGENRLWWQ